jgi:hypothetical protein
MAKYIPFPAYADDVPLDLSFVYENEKPAGRHGFLQVSGDQFVFEDGTVVRFWGTNFNGGANFPDFDYAEKVAKRLSKIGVNIVRFHQLDAEWDTPNIYQFTKGARVSNTLSFDPESMKRLDYLIYCLKKEGIYCYLDIFTYRKFKTGDGVENAFNLRDAAKPYSGFNRKLIELQKRAAYDFWTHINPYTGLAYKDDPVFVMCEVVNESEYFHFKIDVEPYESEFRNLFAKWLEEEGLNYDAYNCDVNGKDKELIDFKVQLQKKYYIEMISYMREIGVKIPITGTNHTICSANCKAQTVTDFCDTHVYFYDWKWGETEKFCMNKAITHVPENGFATLSLMCVFDKPFFVSEWDMPWPNEFRAESPLLYAAVGALQGWSGFTIHTYSYSSRLDNMNILGKEVSSSTIGGVPYREGIFSTWNDPAKFGLFYHSALITRRGDVSRANNKYAIKIEDLMGKDKPAFNVSSELSQIAAHYEGDTEARLISEKEVLVDPESGEVRSDTGELYRSWAKNYGTIDTDKTKCAYGFLEKNGRIDLKGLELDCKTDFAVIALSSLTNEPIEKSDNILLTTVGRAKNTDAKFDGEQMLDYGRPPILIEVIEVDISLKTEYSTLKVWAVNAEGFYVGAIPATYENGSLKFTLGKQFPSMYYLIQAE